MAVGKGSMARASKAAAGKKADTKATVVANADEKVVEAVAVDVKEDASKAAPKKAAAKKATTKKVTPKKEEAPVAAAAVVEATSEQVMKEIVYQKSSQVLDREPEVNETFGIGEAMPIYLFQLVGLESLTFKTDDI